MAKLGDLSVRHHLFMRTYRYRHVDWRPGTLLRCELSKATVALVTTAGLHLPDQLPFDLSIKGGDTSWRIIPGDAVLASLRISHKSDAFDHSGITQDRNLALPLDRLRELAAAGVVGRVAPRHFSLMGSITSPESLIERSAPEIAAHLADDGVDTVLLTPV